MKKTTELTIGKLYKSLDKAKCLQIDIVGEHGEEISEASRTEIVKIWDALDEAGASIHRIMQNEGIHYAKFI